VNETACCGICVVMWIISVSAKRSHGQVDPSLHGVNENRMQYEESCEKQSSRVFQMDERR
jgi:type IV secretory pathway TrbD component